MLRSFVFGSGVPLLLALALTGAAADTPRRGAPAPTAEPPAGAPRATPSEPGGPPQPAQVPAPKAPVPPAPKPPVAPPPCPVVSKLSSEAAQEVRQSHDAAIQYQYAAAPAARALGEHVVLRGYQAKVDMLANGCLNRTYTAADNTSAGCVSRDSPASCAKKLFDWCMQPYRAGLREQRDNMVANYNHEFATLQRVMQQTLPLIYPSS